MAREFQGNEYLLLSIAVVVIGGTSVAGGKAIFPGVWGRALFLVLLQTMLNTFGASAGVRSVAHGVDYRCCHYGCGWGQNVTLKPITASQPSLHRHES